MEKTEKKNMQAHRLVFVLQRYSFLLDLLSVWFSVGPCTNPPKGSLVSHQVAIYIRPNNIHQIGVRHAESI